MRFTHIAPAIVLGTVLLNGCGESPVAVEPSMLSESEPSLAVRTGETLSKLVIKDPSTSAFTLGLGDSKQMSATLMYSRGGTLSSAPYATWRSSDNCVATVTSASPSWGRVRGVRSGTALIISEAWGKADTVKVTVSGSNYPTKACYDAEWSWDYSDVSFTGSPASSYTVRAGEALRKLVLFAGPNSNYTIGVGAQAPLRGEMWYSKGGKLNAAGYATFAVTDGSVADINRKGVVTGLKAGRTKVIVRLGEFSDTVPLYVR